MDQASGNPLMPAPLRITVLALALVVGWAGLSLFLFAGAGQDGPAWATAPFDARFAGAARLSVLPPLCLLAGVGRLVPGRVGLWMLLTFAGVTALVAALGAGALDWGRPSTWAFWALCSALVVVVAFHLRDLREGLRRTPEEAVPQGRRNLLTAVAGCALWYGLALLVTPTLATAFWPWPVDAAHGRIHAVAYLTLAAGTWAISRRSAPAADAAVGLAMLTLGVLAIGGTLWTDLTWFRVAYDVPGTWVFFAGNAALAAVGAGLSREFTLAPAAAGQDA